tara:strand:+ start:43224 stop:43625 length:402 start_codon:yes stop_codon:yes gene_type:complete
MKITKTASGKSQVKMSKKEWQDLGKKAGWMKKAQYEDEEADKHDNLVQAYQLAFNEIKALIPNMERRLSRSGIPVEEFEKIMSIAGTLKERERMINEGIQYTTDSNGVESDVVPPTEKTSPGFGFPEKPDDWG